jgi:hypothetical protein
MRILELTYHHIKDLRRIYWDAGTPPPDRYDLERFMRDVGDSRDPRAYLVEAPDLPGILELTFVAPTSGHRYGVLFVDMVHVADAIAYWREPPIFVDRTSPTPHGLSRAHAHRLAAQRLESVR